jgi:DNA-directed RNA polymerase subunit H|tara:strand:+ start:35 stop:790 length:756 start_codon:yes stop_codon:yes gene_type:complete
MHLLEKVHNTRIQLKKLLENEWNTDIIHDVSLKELEIMYSTQNENTYINSGCNFTLTNLKIPSHKLHVIYYNFPELHRSGTKINKTCCDKLTSYYEKEGFDDDYLFEKEDSLLIIINEKVSESLAKNIEEMYLKGQDELMKYGISDDIQKEMKTNKFEMDKPYFRNIHIFHIDVLTIDLLSHRLVPKHEVIRNKEEIKQIFEDTKTNEYLLPVILRTDPIAKLKRLCPGNICKIIRSSQTSGENVYYRICK